MSGRPPWQIPWHISSYVSTKKCGHAAWCCYKPARCVHSQLPSATKLMQLSAAALECSKSLNVQCQNTAGWKAADPVAIAAAAARHSKAMHAWMQLSYEHPYSNSSAGVLPFCRADLLVAACSAVAARSFSSASSSFDSIAFRSDVTSPCNTAAQQACKHDMLNTHTPKWQQGGLTTNGASFHLALEAAHQCKRIASLSLCLQEHVGVLPTLGMHCPALVRSITTFNKLHASDLFFHCSWHTRQGRHLRLLHSNWGISQQLEDTSLAGNLLYPQHSPP